MNVKRFTITVKSNEKLSKNRKLYIVQNLKNNGKLKENVLKIRDVLN